LAGSLAAGLRAAGRRLDPALLAAFLVGLATAAVIRMTLLPTVGSWDTAEAQTVLPLLGTMHPTGFPAYVVIGWLASLALHPFGTPAYVVNLLSAILVAIAAGGTVLVARRLGAPVPLATAIAAGFAVTPLVWSIGNAADVHALHLALVVLVVLGLLRWERLVGLRRERPADPGLARRADRAIVVTAAVFGVMLANHGLAALLVPAVGLFVLAVEPGVLRRPRLVLAALGACAGTAALLYLELPLRAGPFPAPLVYGHPETWSGFWDIVLARQFQGDVIGPFADLQRKARDLAALASAQYGPLVALVPVGALVTAVRRPRYGLLSIVAVAVTCFFAASYVNARIDRYYLGPVFFGWSWLAVLGATVVDLVTWRGRARRAFAPEPATVPSWSAPRTVMAIAVGLALLVPTGTALSARWRAQDRSGETWVDTWLDQALDVTAPDAVVISWWSYSTPLWYAQLVEGRRPDIFILDDRIRVERNELDLDAVIAGYLPQRPVYVIRSTSAEIQDLATRWDLEWAGGPANLYRVTGKKETTP
jgi:hypothetical protein